MTGGLPECYGIVNKEAALDCRMLEGRCEKRVAGQVIKGKWLRGEN